MKKIFTTLMTLLLCACMVFTFTACTSQEDIDNAVNEATAPLNTQITALEAELDDKEAKLATLEAEKAALISEKEAFADRNDELEESILAKETEISEFKSSIAVLQSEKAELEAKIEELEEENEILKSCLAGNHVLDTKGEISYAWSRSYSTCTAKGVCVYCNNEAIERARGVTNENKITATFENSELEAQVVHTVTTYGELRALLESGETVSIRLDATLENIQSLNCRFDTTAVLDMNGNDITFEPGYDFSIDTASLMLTGEGAITASGTTTIHCRGTLFIEDDVTINGDWYAISFAGYDYADATAVISGGTVNAQGNGVNFNFENEYISLTITGGTFSVNPFEYVDTENYIVTDNENGTWTVSCNHNSSAHTVADDNGDLTHTFTCTLCGSIAKGNHSFEESDECICGAAATLVSTPDELIAALAKGGDIKLMDNISRPNDPLYEGFSSDVVVHLNGYNITVTPNGGGLQNPILYVVDGGSLTINGEGTVTHENSVGPSIYCEKGELTVCKGTFNGNVDIHSGTVTITGGTFNDTVDAFNGTLTITGGTFNSYVDVHENSTLTITGGTFNLELNVHSGDVTITGGTFNSHIHVSDASLTITGGTFFENPSEYVDTENYIVTYNENHTWTVSAR